MFGGLEGFLDVVAWIILVAGVVLAIVPIFLLSFSGIVPSLSIVVAATLSWVLLRAAAEILRLLKHIAGLPYGGRISKPNGPENSVFLRCSNCNSLLHSKLSCDACGEKIQAE
jgi:hypothetical protein